MPRCRQQRTVQVDVREVPAHFCAGAHCCARRAVRSASTAADAAPL